MTESLLIMEFLADLFPHSNLLPSSPVLRARIRAFIHFVDTTFVNAFNAVFEGRQPTSVLDALEQLQARLPPGGGFAVGEWSNADVAVAPFLARAHLMLKHDIGRYPVGEGPRALEKLRRDAKYVRVMKYVDDIWARPCFKATWDEVRLCWSAFGMRSDRACVTGGPSGTMEKVTLLSAYPIGAHQLAEPNSSKVTHVFVVL